MNEMYIRSQDKAILLTFDGGVLECYREPEMMVKPEEYRDSYVICCRKGSGTYRMGKYESKERCIEVMDEIQHKCGMYLKLEGGPALIRGGMDVQPAVFNIPRVYEMPEK